jgi:hypothetical protein
MMPGDAAVSCRLDCLHQFKSSARLEVSLEPLAHGLVIEVDAMIFTQLALKVGGPSASLSGVLCQVHVGNIQQIVVYVKTTRLLGDSISWGA